MGGAHHVLEKPCRRLAPWAGLLLPALLALPGASLAQSDPSGEWRSLQHEDRGERGQGPDVGDYLGVPINAQGRAKADAWMASFHELLENQCRPHPADYAWRGPFNMRVWTEYDRYTQNMVAVHTHGSWQQPEQTIWLDGRPHPPAEALHTWQGFSTGQWEGDTLHIHTTHLTEGWLRRNGLNRSDYTTVSTHMMRHGDYMTVVVIDYDPVYLTEPFMRSSDYALYPQQRLQPYPCETQVEVEHKPGTVPHYLPGTNPYLEEWAAAKGIPPAATRGGAEMMYPEYIKTMEKLPRIPRSGRKPDGT